MIGGSAAALGAARLASAGLDQYVELHEVRLLDSADPAQNPHLAFVLDDTVALIEALRASGRKVVLHGVQGYSRTPTVAALYGARRTGRAPCDVLAEVQKVLPFARPNPLFRKNLT